MKFGIQEYFVFLESVSAYLDPLLIEKAKYIEYGEWEMAYEAILLGLIEQNRDEISFDIDLAKGLADEADIISQGVMDINTWDKFLAWESCKR